MLLKESALEAGENRVKFQMEVSKPALWWPRGYGDQVRASLFSRQLYSSLRCGAAAVYAPRANTVLLRQPLYELSLTVRGESEERRLCVDLGLRQARLVTKPDDIGESFYLEINGIYTTRQLSRESSAMRPIG